MEMDSVFAIKTKHGTFVGVDQASGGYPYLAKSIRQIETWATAEQAAQYMRVCQSEAAGQGWRVVEVTFDAKEIKYKEQIVMVTFKVYADTLEQARDKVWKALNLTNKVPLMNYHVDGYR